MVEPSLPLAGHGLAERFRRADQSFPSSPLYRRLVAGVAGDEDLLSMAGRGRPGQAPEFLLLGAVHLLVRRRPDQPLAGYYPDGHRPVLTDDPFPAFRSFCLEHRDEVEALVATRLVQTNEPRRSAALLLGLAVVATDEPRPMALIEVGASAGLNLRFDRYRYHFGPNLEAGDPAASVVVRCRAVGTIRPPVPVDLPVPVQRVGIDLHPVDVADDEAVEWLSALLSPEDEGRRVLLEAACRAARSDPPTLVGGDVFDVLPAMVAALPRHLPVCIFHSSVLFHFPPALRPAFGLMITGLATERDVHWLSLEGAGTTYRLDRPPAHNHQVLGLTSLTRAGRSERLLALFDPHGAWVEWLAGP